MSREDVELVRAAFDAYEHEGLEGILRFYDTEVEWTPTAEFVESSTYRGHDGVRRYFDTVAGEFDDFRLELEEVLDAGDQVVVVSRLSGQGKSSGVPVELKLMTVSSLRNGKVIRNRNYPTRSEALEAAGFREHADLAMVREAVVRFANADIDGLVEFYDPDAFIVAPEGWPEGGRFEGRDAVMRQYERVQEEWESQSMRIERERAHGDWIVLEMVWDAEGKASGVGVEMRVVGAYRARAGKIAEARFFWNFDEALAAAGIAG